MDWMDTFSRNRSAITIRSAWLRYRAEITRPAGTAAPAAAAARAAAFHVFAVL
jgi:hypothetical protein